MKLTLRLIAVVSILLVLGEAKAQTLAHFVTPTNNSTGVSVGTTITITTKCLGRASLLDKSGTLQANILFT